MGCPAHILLIDMGMDTCMDMCIDTCTNMFGDTNRQAYRHVHISRSVYNRGLDVCADMFAGR